MMKFLENQINRITGDDGTWGESSNNMSGASEP